MTYSANNHVATVGDQVQDRILLWALFHVLGHQMSRKC